MKRCIALMLILYGCANVADAQVDQVLPAIGGGGGGQFVARCRPSEILSGFELHTGDDVDAVRALCVAPDSYQHAGPRRADDNRFGGSGGRAVQLVCPDNGPQVIGISIGYEGADTQIVNNVHVFCGVVAPNQSIKGNPTAAFDGPAVGHRDNNLLIGGDPVPLETQYQSCPPGLVAVGINGRSGIWLDALGLVCGAPPIVGGATPITSIGRIGSSRPPRPARPICEAARDARARNSPAAANLEAQCAATKSPITSIGRVGTSSPVDRSRSICDAARDARARNSPAAPNLEAQCHEEPPPDDPPEDGDAQAAQGRQLAGLDPLAMALRGRQKVGSGQRGFDIGMKVAQGQTAAGPGKQRIHDTLSADEQRGFEAAVAYSLERNRNADLAARGAAVSRADRAVAQAHNAESDVFYWLGFDIATGLFGDPALGALGETAMSATTLAVRNSLSAPGQRGFDAALRFHVQRMNRR